MHVHGGACSRASRAHLEQPRLARAVDEQVEPQQLEAREGVRLGAGAARRVGVGERRLRRDQRLDHQLLDLAPEEVGVEAAARELLEDLQGMMGTVSARGDGKAACKG